MLITASLIELSIRSISDRSDCEGVSVRTEDTFNINFKRWTCCHFLGRQQMRIWVILFTIWFLSLSNSRNFRASFEIHVAVCVKIYLIWWRFTHVVAKCFRGSLFFWTQLTQQPQTSTKARHPVLVKIPSKVFRSASSSRSPPKSNRLIPSHTFHSSKEKLDDNFLRYPAHKQTNIGWSTSSLAKVVCSTNGLSRRHDESQRWCRLWP